MTKGNGKPDWLDWQVSVVKALGFDPGEITELVLRLKADELPKVVIYKDMRTVSGDFIIPQTFRFVADNADEDGE